MGKNKPMKKLFLNEQERFWDTVDISEPESCWLWKGCPSTQGYGRFSFRHNSYKAHRIAYFLLNGIIDNNLLVLHTCDVRLCCNPAHLYQGDAKKNTQDALKRGRHTRMYGEQNGKAKLNEKEVRSIRHRYRKGGITQKTLAQYHGVSETTIYYICKGERWINLLNEKIDS
jgi:DNA-binding XRE family transcriptional regulator